ncbi:MAG: RNA ligase family protein, partial [Chloroflexota bacterium]
NLTGKLAGSEKNRVKTIRLRGNISQGIVAAPSDFANDVPEIANVAVGADVTALLGIEKYEPPVVLASDATLHPLPEFVSKYDIEGAQNHVDVVASLMDVPVIVTEKLEGSHWSMTWLREGDRVVVSQRNYSIEPRADKPHTWFTVSQEMNLEHTLREMAAELEPRALTLRGEMLGPGIQANYYKLKSHTLYLFEIEVDGMPVDAERFMALTDKWSLPAVPVLSFGPSLRDWLGEQTLKAASDGTSKIADRPREGVVIRPMTEMRTDRLGRTIIKQRGPNYLAKSDF